MKRFFLFAIMAIMLCLGACKQDGYKISGTVNGGQDGDTVVLVSMTFDTIQTAIIKNGEFVFKGTQDTAQICYIIWSSKDNPEIAIGTIMAHENGNITVKLDTDDNVPSEISGTKANDALCALNKAEQAINNEAKLIYETINDTSSTEEAQIEAQSKINDLEERMIELYKSFITENIQNVAGQTYLTQFAMMLPDEFVIEQIETLPADFTFKGLDALRETYDVIASTAVGKPFKDIKANTPEGDELSVSDVAKNAKVLMIDFWASWCGPCRAEMPNVKATYDMYHSQGFEIIGISLDQDASDWKQAIADLGMTWPQISDLKGWMCDGCSIYGIRSIPATILIKDGKIVARNLRDKALTEKVAELVK